MLFRSAAIVVASVVVSAQMPARAEDVPVTSATIRIERRAVDRFVLLVENLHDVPLETWVINAGSHSVISDFSAPDFPLASGSGPIHPHEVRAIKLPEGFREVPGVVPAATLAVFEDGLAQGAATEIETWAQVRRQRVDNATFWLTALERGVGKSEAEAKVLLTPIVLQRRQQNADARDARPRGGLSDYGAPEPLTETVAQILGDTASRPEGWISARLTDLRDTLRKRRLAMLRPISPSTGQSSLTLRLVNEPATNVFAIIENLRDVPIEAFEFEWSNSATGSPGGGQLEDACLSIDRPGNRIQPHEIRTISLGTPAVTPYGRMKFVLYDDLVFEGSGSARDDLFRARERQADDIRFWIDALRDARGKPASAVRPFLLAKQRERIQSTGEDRLSAAMDALQFADVAERQPTTFAQAIDAKIAHELRVIAALTRHPKR